MSETKISDFVTRFNELLDALPLSDASIARKLNVSKQTVSAWRCGARTPKRPTLSHICATFGVRESWLMGCDAPMTPDVPALGIPGIIPIRRVAIPVLGGIAAGQPIQATQEYGTYVEADEDLRCSYALRVDGDSMEPTIRYGDLVFIRQQDDVDDGDIAAVLINDSATLKRVIHIKNGLTLVSDNTARYSPMTFTYPECDTIRILGKAVAFKRIL